jgi:hypothetical protein
MNITGLRKIFESDGYEPKPWQVLGFQRKKIVTSEILDSAMQKKRWC